MDRPSKNKLRAQQAAAARATKRRKSGDGKLIMNYYVEKISRTCRYLSGNLVWCINSVSSKRIQTAYKTAQSRKAAKRIRQEISRAKDLASQKQFSTQSKARKQLELAEYTPSSEAAKKQVKETFKKLK